MSRTTIWIADQAGTMRRGPEFHNAWRSAAAVWEHLGGRWGHKRGEGSILMDKAALSALWNDAANPARPWHERVVLACTFDRALVRREEFEVVAGCMDAVAARMTVPQSLTEQAATLRELAGDETVTAIGWQQTSVAEELWWVSSDEDEEDGHPYVIGTDPDAEAWVLGIVGPREETK
jgi:hypothetical protein